MRLSLEEPPESRGLAHNGHSEIGYTGLHLDNHSSKSTSYTGFHLDDYPSGSPLKDGDLPTIVTRSRLIRVFTLTACSATLDARSQLIMGYVLMAAEQVNRLHGSSPRWRPFMESPERWGLTHVGCSEPT